MSLQSKDSAALGFCPANVLSRTQGLICQRCFGLMHYGHGRDQGTFDMPAAQYERELKQLRRMPGVAVHVVDILDLAGTLNPKQFQQVIGDHASVLVANKSDLLPKDANEQRLVRLLERLGKTAKLSKLHSAHLVSARTGEGVNRLMHALTDLGEQGKPIFCVGYANVGAPKPPLRRWLMVRAVVQGNRGC